MRDDNSLNNARSVGAVVHALLILRHLARQGIPSGVTAISRATNTNTSTCFNILRTLVTEKLVTFDPDSKTYRLGFGVVELALGLLGTNHGDLIRPELDRLALSSSALICLWLVTDDNRLVLLDRAFAPRAVRVDMPVGKRLPLLAGAVGRAVAASLDLDELELRKRFLELRWQNPVTADEFVESVLCAKRLGYGRDKALLFSGLDSVSSVVCDQLGRPRYGISAIALLGQLSDAEMGVLGEDIRSSAQRIGTALFFGRADTENSLRP